MNADSFDRQAGFADKPVIRPSLSALLSRDFSPCGPERIRVGLPVGFAAPDGRLLREAWVKPLDGRAEISSETAGGNAGFNRWVTTLISHTVGMEGGIPNGHPAAQLSVADRDMLVLALRILTFGPELWGIVRCPSRGCEKLMDIALDLTAMGTPSGKGGGPVRTATIEHGGRRTRMKYREPNGSDQEAVSAIACSDPRKAQVELLSRCLIDVEGLADTSPEALSGQPPDVLRGIDRAISETMTSFDWDLQISCSECARPFVSTLDIQAFFWEELQMTRDDFWNEVHQIAFHYHWSEAEILSLSRWRRKMYLSRIRRHTAHA